MVCYTIKIKIFKTPTSQRYVFVAHICPVCNPAVLLCSQALHQKAEIFQQTGNLEMALVYFRRALKQQPDSGVLREAVERTREGLYRGIISTGDVIKTV